MLKGTRTHQIMETLGLAEQGFYVASRPCAAAAIRPLPWRRILQELPRLGRDDVLEVAPGTNGSSGDLVVRRIAANGRGNGRPGVSADDGGTRWVSIHRAVPADTRLAHLARRIEMAVRNGECRRVIVLRAS